jgi:hypothetical protein
VKNEYFRNKWYRYQVVELSRRDDVNDSSTKGIKIKTTTDLLWEILRSSDSVTFVNLASTRVPVRCYCTLYINVNSGNFSFYSIPRLLVQRSF